MPVTIDNVTGSILRDGKAAVSTLGAIFGSIEKIAIAATGVYLLSKKFPAATNAVKEAVGGVFKEVSKGSPLLAKVFNSISGQFAKLAKTDLGKRIGIALVAPLATKALLLMGAAAVIAAGAFAKLFLNRARMASDLKDLQNALDSTVAAAQGIKAASQVTRVSVDDVRTAIQHIEQAVSEAVSGSDEYQQSFARLGLTMDQVRKMTPEELFYRLADGVKQGKIGVGNFSQLLKVMGRDAKTLIPAMKAGFVDIAKEMQGLGSNRNVIDLLADADTQIQKLKVSATGLIGGFTTGLAADAVIVTKWAASFAQLITESQQPIKGIKGMFGPGEAWERFGQRQAQVKLATDDDYAASKEETSRLESHLKSRQSIHETEKAELKTLKEKNAEKAREVELDGMTAAQRKAALEDDRAALQSQISSTKNAIDREKLQTKLLDVQEKLTKHKHEQGFQGENIQSDAMTRLGLFRGGGSVPGKVITVLNQQAAIQREMVNQQMLGIRALDRIIQETQRLNSAMEDV